MNNPETVVRFGTQDTGGRQTKHKPNHEQSRNSGKIGHTIYRRKQTKHKPNHEQSRNSGKIGHTRYRRKTNKTQTES